MPQIQRASPAKGSVFAELFLKIMLRTLSEAIKRRGYELVWRHVNDVQLTPTLDAPYPKLGVQTSGEFFGHRPPIEIGETPPLNQAIGEGDPREFVNWVIDPPETEFIGEHLHVVGGGIDC